MKSKREIYCRLMLFEVLIKTLRICISFVSFTSHIARIWKTYMACHIFSLIIIFRVWPLWLTIIWCNVWSFNFYTFFAVTSAIPVEKSWPPNAHQFFLVYRHRHAILHIPRDNNLNASNRPKRGGLFCEINRSLQLSLSKKIISRTVWHGRHPVETTGLKRECFAIEESE